MNVAILFSGGKDSTMAVYAALEAKEDVKYLLSMKSKNDESYMFHVPNIHVTDLLSEALDIPIMSVETEGVKEEELDDFWLGPEEVLVVGVGVEYEVAGNSVPINKLRYPYSNCR